MARLAAERLLSMVEDAASRSAHVNRLPLLGIRAISARL